MKKELSVIASRVCSLIAEAPPKRYDLFSSLVFIYISKPANDARILVLFRFVACVRSSSHLDLLAAILERSSPRTNCRRTNDFFQHPNFIRILFYVQPVHAGWYVEFKIIIFAQFVCTSSPNLNVSNPYFLRFYDRRFSTVLYYNPISDEYPTLPSSTNE